MFGVAAMVTTPPPIFLTTTSFPSTPVGMVTVIVFVQRLMSLLIVPVKVTEATVLVL